MAILTVTGRLGKDCETREMQNGTKVVSFSVADDVGYGEKKRTQWIKCSYFGDRAAKLAQYLTKGSLIEVTGSASTEAWVKKADNSPQATLTVNVMDVRLHGGGKKDEAEAPKGRATAPIADDEIPF